MERLLFFSIISERRFSSYATFFSFAFLTLILLYPFKALAQVTPADYFSLNNQITQDAIHKVISTRCYRYFSNVEDHDCDKSTTKLLNVLDYEVIFLSNITTLLNSSFWSPNAFLFVAFKNDLLSLLDHAQTKQFLNELNQKLNLYLTGEDTEFNLWGFTKKFYGAEYQASRVLAVLFQDTSFRKLHLMFLEKTKPNNGQRFLSNIELLSRIIDTFNFLLDSHKDSKSLSQSAIQMFYPRNPFSQKLNRNIYHFYVPLYLAQKMKYTRNSLASSLLSPLALTLTYEFITTSQSYSFLINDPDHISSDHKIRDIYAGYLGSKMGTNQARTIKSFDAVKAYFKSSTQLGVEYLLP